MQDPPDVEHSDWLSGDFPSYDHVPPAELIAEVGILGLLLSLLRLALSWSDLGLARACDDAKSDHEGLSRGSPFRHFGRVEYGVQHWRGRFRLR